MSIRLNRLLCLGPNGFHRIAYRRWESPGCERHLVCAHGLTRNSHDFDRFAATLRADYQVTCPDVVGRGKSDWLPVKSDYGYALYASDMATLLARLDTEHVDWVGTSMGGLIGLLLAAQPHSPIRKLVLNDVGPHVPAALTRRILSYLGSTPRFDTLEAARAYLQDLYRGFGPLTEAQWLEVAVNSTHRLEDGRYTLAYDPGIGDAWRAVDPDSLQDLDYWHLWDSVRCPVLVLRGEESDALTAQAAAQMQRRGPNTTVIEIPKTGHCPPLMDPEQIAFVRDWLLAD